MRTIIEFTGFEGHIILYCKNHYNSSGNMLEDLKRIWAVRCGYSYDKNDNSMIISIVSVLYKILSPTIDDLVSFNESLHAHLLSWLYSEMDINNKLISFYVSRIANMQIKDKVDGKLVELVKLPKPKKRVFNRILRGNGRYEDYKLIN